MEPSKEYMERITSAAQQIVNARELCGNERQALLDWESDNGKLSTPDRMLAVRHANRMWESFQREAGVTAPISREERAEITRVMERAA